MLTPLNDGMIDREINFRSWIRPNSAQSDPSLRVRMPTERLLSGCIPPSRHAIQIQGLDSDARVWERKEGDAERVRPLESG